MSERPTILFVDDEANVLSGIRRMLAHKRAVWDVATAESGAEALRRMDQAPVDVVVTDMRMPGMSGAQVLDAVRARHPDTIRFVLSGQSSDEETLRVVGQSHQYLSKPCQASVLEDRLARALRTRDVLRGEVVRTIVSRLRNAPSPPSTYLALTEEFRSGTTSDERVDDIVSRDPSLAARLLGIVNSAYFGVMHTVTRPSQAVFYLGYNTVRALALSSGILSGMSNRHVGPIDAEHCLDHALRTRRLANAFAETLRLGPPLAEEAVTAALLHDIGVLVLMENFPEIYADLPAGAPPPMAALQRHETERLGAGHAEIGAFLLAAWGLPHWIVEATLCQHHPLVSGTAEVTPVTIVHLACGLEQAAEGRAANAAIKPESFIDMAYLDALGLKDRLDAFIDLADALARPKGGGAA